MEAVDLYKFFEKVVAVEPVDAVLRQLLEERDVRVAAYGISLVLSPIVYEMLLKVRHPLVVDHVAVIEFLKNIEELMHVVIIFVYLIKLSPRLDQREDVTHYVTENTHSKDQEETSQESFGVRTGVNVSESNSRQGCHSIIYSGVGFLRVAL